MNSPVQALKRGRGVTAVLGPTNTGKTHLAIERMLGHSSGLIGLPLRLLAREVYSRAVEKVGAESVALITGEEKIKPPNPRYWISTVEAMPSDLDVAFVAVDEVQLCGDLERGHIFTDRMLNRRGREETLMLGAATMRPLVRAAVAGRRRDPAAAAVAAHLRRREEDHAPAAPLRDRRVLGRRGLCHRRADPPPARRRRRRARRAVAAHPQRPGRALSVRRRRLPRRHRRDRHGAQSRRRSRRLRLGPQIRRLPVPPPDRRRSSAQIAGRAGRAQRDGTFGTTGRCPAFETELVEQLESHTFEAVPVLQWRNTALDFRSIEALLESLAITPTEEGLTRAPVADDVRVLERAAREDEVRELATTRQGRAAPVGGLPDPRLPQDRAGGPCRAGPDPLWIPGAGG